MVCLAEQEILVLVCGLFPHMGSFGGSLCSNEMRQNMFSWRIWKIIHKSLSTGQYQPYLEFLRLKVMALLMYKWYLLVVRVILT